MSLTVAMLRLTLHLSSYGLLVSAILSTMSTSSAVTDTSTSLNCGTCTESPPVLPDITFYFRQTIDAIIKMSPNNSHLFPSAFYVIDNSSASTSTSTGWSSTNMRICSALINLTQQTNKPLLTHRSSVVSDVTIATVQLDVIAIVGGCIVIGLPIMSLITTYAARKCRYIGKSKSAVYTTDIT